MSQRTKEFASIPVYVPRSESGRCQNAEEFAVHAIADSYGVYTSLLVQFGAWNRYVLFNQSPANL